MTTINMRDICFFSLTKTILDTAVLFPIRLCRPGAPAIAAPAPLRKILPNTAADRVKVGQNSLDEGLPAEF
jgi:hypothetical protein